MSLFPSNCHLPLNLLRPVVHQLNFPAQSLPSDIVLLLIKALDVASAGLSISLPALMDHINCYFNIEFLKKESCSPALSSPLTKETVDLKQSASR